MTPSPTTVSKTIINNGIVKGMEIMSKHNTYAPDPIMLQWDTGIMQPYQYKTFPTIQDAQEFIKENDIVHWSMWKFMMRS